MKTSTKFIIAGTATILAAAAIFGGVQVANALRTLSAPGGSHLSLAPLGAATPTASATKAPAVVDPVVAAQASSGLTVAQYQAVTAQVAAIKAPGQAFNSLSPSSFHAAMDGLAAQYGKPVTAIVKIICPATDNPGAVSWGVTGSLYGSSGGCGTGYEASRETAIAKALERANDRGLIAGDYVIVFADWTN